MKNFILLLTLLLSFNAFSQIKEGAENNGNKNIENVKPIENTNSRLDINNIDVNNFFVNKKNYKRNLNAKQLIKISGQPHGLWINSEYVKSTGSGNSYSLDVNSCYMYFTFSSSPTDDQTVISERIKVLNNVYKNYKIDTLEYRNVNGEKVMFLHSQGDYGTSHQVITGYYKAYSNGNIRIYAVVVEEYYNKNRKQIHEVLNGLVYLKD